METVELSKRLISDEEYAIAKKGLEELKKESFKLQKDRPRKGWVSQLHFSLEAQSLPLHHRTLLRTERTAQIAHGAGVMLRIGDVAFASNRFELYTDYMH